MGATPRSQIDALGEPAMAIVVVATAEGLGNERIESQQKAYAEERGRVEDGVAKSDGADRDGTELADHDGVDDALGHPAEFAEDDGDSEASERGQFPLPLILRAHPAILMASVSIHDEADAGADRVSAGGRCPMRPGWACRLWTSRSRRSR